MKEAREDRMVILVRKSDVLAVVNLKSHIIWATVHEHEAFGLKTGSESLEGK